jgi:truncated hemoglobin YjbI
MTKYEYPNFPPQHGYMSEIIQSKYITSAIEKKLLPVEAHRMPGIVSLTASNDEAKPIQFWQLFSVLGQNRIVRIVTNFYERVYRQEEWFRSVFARIGGADHHMRTQASMWLDVMGGGLAYHGAEFRLNFHHTHNAMELMNDKGATLWAKLMVETLDETAIHMTDDPRVRIAINTFLAHFFEKYATDFNFNNASVFGDTNPPVTRKINFMNMTNEAIQALTEAELRQALIGRGVDASKLSSKKEMVSKALNM